MHLGRLLSIWVILIFVGSVPLLGYFAYWSVPRLQLELSGDPILAYDREIGFVPRPNSSTIRTEQGLTYRVYTDRRGARVSQPGEQTPDKIDILFIGDSFTWGHGVENEETYAALVPKVLGISGANIALGSYGTTQALQMLRRNLDLRPRIVVYPIITNHLRRNVSACSPSYYPFCADVSFVSDGKIKPPRTNGVRRTYLQVEYERAGLDPLTWLVHGADVVLGRWLAGMAAAAASDHDAQYAALRFLLSEMEATTKSIGARLVVVFIPGIGGAQLPSVLADAGLNLLDLSGTMRPEMYLPDGHPNAVGHQFIAEQISARVAFHRSRSAADSLSSVMDR